MKPNKAIHYILFFLFLCLGGTLAAQDDEFSLGPTGITDGETYAVIIGISKYKHIDSLRYAHRDAELFASFLQSDAGGNVPTENIKLLTDEQATISNIYMAKQWLEDIANEDDLVFFYFAGHGDVESSLYKLGFLLAHDTPKKNYFNNAVRIEDINIMANTLSIKKKAKVMLITDACHSGKLAGSDNRGRQLVGDQLSTVTSNEVRIASCAADQLSQEDEFWGGGRGAFSFHLINGLKGLADEPGEEDNIVTLFELEDYLSKNVMKDVFKEMRKEQTPVIQGKKTTKMAIVDDDILAAITQSNEGQSGAIPSGLGSNRSVVKALSTADTYFKAIQRWDIDKATIKALAAHPTWDIVSKVKELFPNQDSQNEAVNTYLSSIAEDPALTIDFNRRLAAAIHDQCQAAINAYLAADAEELKRRQYYNAKPEEFELLANKLEFAQTLVSEKNYLHQIMMAKAQYFHGIAKRLHYLQSDNDKQLLEVAMAYQQASLELDDRASYVHNEIGILLRMSDRYAEAEESWKKASQLTPEWPLPYSNLANLYHKQERYQLGVEFAEKAIELEPSYFMAHVMLARNKSNFADYLTTEEHLRKSIVLNDLHFLGFEELGYLYTTTLDYALADYFFLEAEKRKAGIALFKHGLTDQDFDGIIDLMDLLPAVNETFDCKLNPKKIKEGDATAYCAYAMLMWSQQNYAEAKKYFEKTIVIQQDHPTAYRYLAEIAYMDKHWSRSELFADIAIQNYPSVEELQSYLEANPAKKAYKDCDISTLVMGTYYELHKAQYLHAYVLQKIGRLTAAENVYRKIIDKKNHHLESYLHLIDLHERQEQYSRTESVIHQLVAESKRVGDKELFSFYRRMIDRQIDTVDYSYKAGLLCYYNLPQKDLSYASDQVEPLFDGNGGIIAIDETPSAHQSNIPYLKEISGADKRLTWAPEIGNLTHQAHKNLLASKTDAPTHIKADAAQKLGNLFLYRYKDDEQAQVYFSEASQLYENHAGLRDKLINYYTPRYRLTEAYNQLLQLHSKAQLSYMNTIQLGDYATKRGSYDLAAATIADARSIQPIRNTEVEKTDLLRLLLSDEIGAALKQAKSCLDAQDDPASMHYTIARLHAINGKERKAIKAINAAIDAGFSHTWVLDYDPLISSLRSNPKYDALRARLPIIDVQAIN